MTHVYGSSCPGDLNGYPATLSVFKVDGLAPDGSARPGADLDFYAHFDGSQWCATDPNGGFDVDCCGLGVTWYVNGQVYADHGDVPWSDSMYEALGDGYLDTIHVTAPASGTLVVTAQSANSITFPTVSISATDTNAGTATISEIQCYDPATNLAASCACGQWGAGEITMWFTANPTSLGNGIAYYEVLVNGVVDTSVSPGVVNTNQGTADYSVSITCPSVGSTITIRGITGDAGASTTVGAAATTGNGTTGGGTGDTGTTCDNPCTENFCDSVGNVWICTNGCAARNGSTCTPSGGNTGGNTGGNAGTDIMSQISSFWQQNQTVCIVGGALVLGLLVFGGRRRGEDQ